MASPKEHVIATLPLIVIYFIIYLPFVLFSKDSLIIMATLFFGILIDLDHINSIRLENIKNGSWLERPGHTDWLHTWWGAIVATIVSIILFSWWPLVSFVVHMIFLDSRNRALRKKHGKDPLPEFFHQFWTEKLTYEHNK